jgi:hypothetical protein
VLPRSSDGLVLANQQFPTSTGFLNNDCSAIPVLIFMADHKAETINTVVAAVNQFIKEQGDKPQVQFKLATGNVGVMAATNDVIKDTEHTVLFWLFLCIGICVWLSFRSIASLICVLLPLWMVSVITYAVMVFLDIGLKVSTLPVAAFAAGIGVDYGIYIYSVLEECINRGMTLAPVLRNHAEADRQGGRRHRAGTGRVGLHLAAVGPAVPGRHGHSADDHVPGQRRRRGAAAAGVRRVPGETETGARRRSQRRGQRLRTRSP